MSCSSREVADMEQVGLAGNEAADVSSLRSAGQTRPPLAGPGSRRRPHRPVVRVQVIAFALLQGRWMSHSASFIATGFYLPCLGREAPRRIGGGGHPQLPQTPSKSKKTHSARPFIPRESNIDARPYRYSFPPAATGAEGAAPPIRSSPFTRYASVGVPRATCHSQRRRHRQRIDRQRAAHQAHQDLAPGLTIPAWLPSTSR